MFLLGICLLCSINSLLLAAYPVESQVNSKELTAPLADPADYPDLTNGLSDAEVQESLEDLTLDDLNSLDKLLDEHIGRDVEADSDVKEASLDKRRMPSAPSMHLSMMAAAMRRNPMRPNPICAPSDPPARPPSAVQRKPRAFRKPQKHAPLNRLTKTASPNRVVIWTMT
ncbi:uncharacterized protein [Drosophila takahashii]|uniref:uncharacterized protein isoform X8 n=1 Tax=Drosophila takahashii TaxID=29030 RepID=UPI003898E056